MDEVQLAGRSPRRSTEPKAECTRRGVTCAAVTNRRPCSLKTLRQSTRSRATSLSPHAIAHAIVIPILVIGATVACASRSFQRRPMAGHPGVNRGCEGSTPSAGAFALRDLRERGACEPQALGARMDERPPRMREDPVRFRTRAPRRRTRSRRLAVRISGFQPEDAGFESRREHQGL